MPEFSHKKNDHSFSANRYHPVKNHPRLILTDEHQQIINNRIKEDSLTAVIHKLILKKANRYSLERFNEVEKSGKRILQSVHDISKRIITLSYAWRFTNDERFISAATDDLEKLCDLPDWNPEHFLDAAEITLAVSIGYDWLFYGLSEQQKEKLQSAILNKGLLPSLDAKYNSWLSRNNNWNQVCNAGMAAGSLAVYESNPDLAAKILARSIESNYIALEAYEPDGAYPEGYGYWSYGTHFQVILFSVIESALQKQPSFPIAPAFWKTPDYLRQMIGPSGFSFNYSDSDASVKLNPSMFWFASKKKDPSLLWSEKSFLSDPSKISSRDLVFLMLWADPEQIKKITKPEEQTWYGRGINPVVIMRSGWEANDFYVGIKGGSPSVNHGQMDVGSFVLDALGERWVLDPGREDYYKMESGGLNIWSYKQNSDRWKIWKNKPEAHSTLMVNYQSQLVDAQAGFDLVQTNSLESRAVLNLTDIYRTSVIELKRTAQLKKKIFTLQDEIKNGIHASIISWRIITDSEIRIKEESEIYLIKNGKTIMIKTKCDPACRAKEQLLTKHYDFETIPKGFKALELNVMLKPGQAGIIRVDFSAAKNFPVTGI